MTTSILIGLIGIVVAFVLLNLLIYWGLNIVLSCVVVSFIVMVTSGLSISETWSIAMSGTGAILGTLAPVIIFGAILGVLYTKSGAANKLANFLMIPCLKAKDPRARLIGCLCMYLLCRIIIGLAGIDNMAIMYTMLAIGAGMFASLGIPRKYLNVLLMVGGTAATLIPGAPLSSLLMIETYIPGFSNSGTLIIRSLMLIIFVVFSVFLMYVSIQRDMDAGFRYEPGPLQFPELSDVKSPMTIVTIIPVLVVYITYNFMSWDAWAALLLGTIVAAVLFGPYIPVEDGKNHFTTIIGAMNSGVFLVPIAILFSMMPGFVMAESEAYNWLTDNLGNLGLPLVFAFLFACIIIVGVASTSSSVLVGSMAVATFIPAGMSAQACGVVFIFATIVLDSLPNNMGLLTQCEILNCSMKECYPIVFKTTVVLTFGLSIVVAILTMLGLIA